MSWNETKSEFDLKLTSLKIKISNFFHSKLGKIFFSLFSCFLILIILLAITLPFFLSGQNKKTIGYTRDASSGTYDAFASLALEVEDGQPGMLYLENTYDTTIPIFNNNVQEVASNDAMIKTVSTSKKSIGYVSSNSIMSSSNVTEIILMDNIDDSGNIITDPLSYTQKDLTRNFNIIWENIDYTYDDWIIDEPKTQEEINQFAAFSFYYWIVDSKIAGQMINTLNTPNYGTYDSDMNFIPNSTQDIRLSTNPLMTPEEVPHDIINNYERVFDSTWQSEDYHIVLAGSTSVKQVVDKLETSFIEVFGFENMTFDTSQMQGSAYALSTTNAHIGFQSKTADKDEIVSYSGQPVSDYVGANAYFPFVLDELSLIINQAVANENDCYIDNKNKPTCYITQSDLLDIYYGYSSNLADVLMPIS